MWCWPHLHCLQVIRTQELSERKPGASTWPCAPPQSRGGSTSQPGLGGVCSSPSIVGRAQITEGTGHTEAATRQIASSALSPPQRDGMQAHMQSQPVEPHRTQWRVYHSASKRWKGHGVASGQTACSPPALPWPEVPLLSASKQHRIQRGVLTEPSDVERANPGAVELQGKASHLSNKNLQGLLLHVLRAT